MTCPKCGAVEVEAENREETNWYCYKCCVFFRTKEKGDK